MLKLLGADGSTLLASTGDRTDVAGVSELPVVGGCVAPDVGLVVGLGVNGLPDGLGVKGLLVSLGDVGVVVAFWANAPDDSPKTIPAASVAKIFVMKVFLVSGRQGET